MAVENLTATNAGSTKPVPGHGFAHNVKYSYATVEVSASASASSTYLLHRLPSNARILPGSTVYFDDMATAGSPTIDMGVYGDQLIGDDADALTNGLAVSSAGSGAMVSGIENWGLPLWDYVSSQASDPGGILEVKAKLMDAAVTTGGTLSSVVLYAID